jgi:hypothetical protein
MINSKASSQAAQRRIAKAPCRRRASRTLVDSD